MRTQTWEISDEFWEQIKSLIPTQKRLHDKTKEYKRNIGGILESDANQNTTIKLRTYPQINQE